jgi:two-component system response regulator AtoC
VCREWVPSRVGLEDAVPNALVLDDDPDVLRPLAELIEREGFAVRSCGTISAARVALADWSCDVIVADLQLPDGDAFELLAQIEESPSTEMIVITGHGSVDSAVQAFRRGAIDYLTKPADTRHLRQLLRKILRTVELRDELDSLRSELRRAGRFGKMIGASAPMQSLYDQVGRVAPTTATVLIHGETGTGKELVAETIHLMSLRAKGPFIAINCGAFTSSLIESELFGHEKGSFTGATQRHLGVFERASGGTLFLDEVTEMPTELQVKLLRTLETRRIERIGGEQGIDIDVRVVAATNREPREAIQEGTLREDLYFRLAVFPIEVPPLRDRGDDIVLIAEQHVDALSEESGESKQLTPDAKRLLVDQPWLGNVRELRNCIERAFIMSTGRIGPGDLPFGTTAHETGDRKGVWVPVGTTIVAAERDLILATLRAVPDKKEASVLLGIGLKTLYNRLHKYGEMD